MSGIYRYVNFADLSMAVHFTTLVILLFLLLRAVFLFVAGPGEPDVFVVVVQFVQQVVDVSGNHLDDGGCGRDFVRRCLRFLTRRFGMVVIRSCLSC